MAYQTQLVPKPIPAPTTNTTNAYDLKQTFDMRAALLLAAIENSTFGLIIVSQEGIVLHKNKRAELFLHELACPTYKQLPNSLWQPCQSLLESQQDDSDLFPADYTIVLEDEIPTEYGSLVHMRVQWFDWDNSDNKPCNCFLITLENREHSLTAIANHEAQRYGLTTRETDVWCLRRMGHSYKEIAQELVISENTVKKHLKNIYAKKEQAQ